MPGSAGHQWIRLLSLYGQGLSAAREFLELVRVRRFGVFLDTRSCDDPHMARLVLVTLGVSLGLYVIGLAIWEPSTLTLPVPVHVAIGWSFVAAGLVAWQQGRSTSRALADRRARESRAVGAVASNLGGL